MDIEQQIIDLFKEPQSEDTLARQIKFDGISYFDLILTVIPEVVKKLKDQGMITHVDTKLYDCGAGNGLAVEHFYQLIERI